VTGLLDGRAWALRCARRSGRQHPRRVPGRSGLRRLDRRLAWL